MEISCIIVFTACMAILPYVASINRTIKDKYFKLIKIKRLSSLFTGIYKESARKHGVILPLFIMQLLGYICAIISTTLAIILPLVFNIELMKVALVLLIILGSLTISMICVLVATEVVSKKRERNEQSRN